MRHQKVLRCGFIFPGDAASYLTRGKMKGGLLWPVSSPSSSITSSRASTRRRRRSSSVPPLPSRCPTAAPPLLNRRNLLNFLNLPNPPSDPRKPAKRRARHPKPARQKKYFQAASTPQNSIPPNKIKGQTHIAPSGVTRTGENFWSPDRVNATMGRLNAQSSD